MTTDNGIICNMKNCFILLFFGLFLFSCSEAASSPEEERGSEGDESIESPATTNQETTQNCETRCLGKVMIACIDGKEIKQDCRFGCENNRCRTCTAGALFCSDDQSAVYLCSTDGQRYSRYQNCQSGLCKQGSCKICIEEEVRCIGSRLQKCEGGYKWVFKEQCQGTCKKNGKECTVYTGPDINGGLLCQTPGSDPVDGPVNWVETFDCGMLETRFQKIADNEIVDHALEGLWVLPKIVLSESFSTASDRCLAAANSRKLNCGLPNIAQLLSLSSYELNNDYFTAATFSQIVGGDFHWSSSKSKNSKYWWLSMKSGLIDFADADSKAYSLCFCPEK